MARPIENILAELDTKALKVKLFEYPMLIKEQKTRVRTKREAFSTLEQERAILEADLATDVSGEMDPTTGKPRFGNDKTRAAELVRRKAENAQYRTAATAAKSAEHKLNEAQDELEMLADKFRACRYVTRLTSEELALMANEEPEEEITVVPGATPEPY